MSDKVTVVGPSKPITEQTLQERMIANGNSIGLKLLKNRGDTTITDEMIRLAETNFNLLTQAGPGYKEARRGW